MSNRNNSQRRTARRFKRTQRATQHHQRGRIDVTTALAVVFVICMAVSVGSAVVAISQSSAREDLFVDRCQHIGGEAVQGINRVMYCVKRDALVVPQ